MRDIIRRLRRLEEVVVPYERERAIAEAILEVRRRRLGADYKRHECPGGWFDGCRDIAERIKRARQFLMQQQSTTGTGSGA